MKTKIVAMLLASVVTVGLLAGCGQGEQKPVSGESEVKTEEKSEEESKEESKQEEIVELKAIFGGTELDEET